MIRSSSHPPRETEGSGDVSGARRLPRSEPPAAENQEGRTKRSTPAERPRRRKQIALERALRDTLPARPQSLRSSRDQQAASEAEPQIDDEAWEEAARLSVISTEDGSDQAPPSARRRTPSSLTPPPPAGPAAATSVPHAIHAEAPTKTAPRARAASLGIRIGLLLLAAVLLWALFRR